MNFNTQFRIKDNLDAKRFEFNSVNNNSISYTVNHKEVENITDATIVVYKVWKKKILKSKE